jgi:O-antigen/teichoic acid export membrane protein
MEVPSDLPNSTRSIVQQMKNMNGNVVARDKDGSSRSSTQKSLRRAAIAGSAWSIATVGGGQVLRLGSNLILARLLLPEVFGLATLALGISKGLASFTDVGVGPNIIQSERGDDPVFLNTAWTIQLLRAVLFALLLVAVAYPVAHLYHEPKLTWVLVAIAIGGIGSGLTSTSLFTMNRHLAIGRLGALTFCEQFVSIAATIACAWVWRSVWAIVAGWYMATLFRVISSHLCNSGQPNRICWDRESRKRLVSFGRWIVVSTAILFFASQLDRLILGRLAALSYVGVYGMALSIASLPQNISARVAASVLYPVLAKEARADRSRFERKVLAARRVLLVASMAMMVGVALMSPWFFEHFYNSRYADARWMAPILCIYVWFSLLQETADRALLALGDTRALAVSNLVNVTVTLVGCVGGYWLVGMPGFVIGVCVSSLASHATIQWALARHGINVVWQDIRYTSTGLALGSLGRLPAVGHSVWGSLPNTTADLAWAGMILVGVGCWAFNVLRNDLIPRRSPRSSLTESIADVSGA